MIESWVIMMSTKNFSDGALHLMQEHPSEYAMKFGKRKAYPYMEEYKQALEKHKKEKEKNGDR